MDYQVQVPPVPVPRRPAHRRRRLVVLLHQLPARLPPRHAHEPRPSRLLHQPVPARLVERAQRPQQDDGLSHERRHRPKTLNAQGASRGEEAPGLVPRVRPLGDAALGLVPQNVVLQLAPLDSTPTTRCRAPATSTRATRCCSSPPTLKSVNGSKVAPPARSTAPTATAKSSTWENTLTVSPFVSLNTCAPYASAMSAPYTPSTPTTP